MSGATVIPTFWICKILYYAEFHTVYFQLYIFSQKCRERRLFRRFEYARYCTMQNFTQCIFNCTSSHKSVGSDGYSDVLNMQNTVLCRISHNVFSTVHLLIKLSVIPTFCKEGTVFWKYLAKINIYCTVKELRKYSVLRKIAFRIRCSKFPTSYDNLVLSFDKVYQFREIVLETT